LGVDDFTDDFSFFGKFGIYVFWALSNLFFCLYDYALSGSVEVYVKYLKPKIFGGKKNFKKILNRGDYPKLQSLPNCNEYS